MITPYAQTAAYAPQSAQSNGPAPQPAQTPTQFIKTSLICAHEANSRLVGLRARLFGDGYEAEDGGITTKGNEPLEAPLQMSCEKLHWELDRLLQQLDAIQNRL